MADINDLGAKNAGRLQARMASSGDSDRAAQVFGQRDEHQPNRSSAQHDNAQPGSKPSVLNALHNARQRLH
jgi:hypothetical protein